MSDPFAHVHPGDDLAIPAEGWNGAMDAARAHRQHSHNQTPGQRSVPRIRRQRACNQTGYALDRFGVVGLDVPRILPTDNEPEFLRVELWDAVAYDVRLHGMHRIGVMLEPAPDNNILARKIQTHGTIRMPITVTDEAHATTGADGEFIPLDNARDTTQPITATLTNATALTEGTDYTVENNGLVVIGTGAIDATGILVSYTKATAEVMEALTNAGEECVLYFNGVNEAQGGKLIAIKMHRVKFSPAQGLSFIGDEFGEISMDFEVLSDQAITGAGLSKFMKVDQVL